MKKFLRFVDTGNGGTPVDLTGKTPVASYVSTGLPVNHAHVAIADDPTQGIVSVDYEPFGAEAIVIIDCGVTTLPGGDRYQAVEFVADLELSLLAVIPLTSGGAFPIGPYYWNATNSDWETIDGNTGITPSPGLGTYTLNGTGGTGTSDTLLGIYTTDAGTCAVIKFSDAAAAIAATVANLGTNPPADWINAASVKADAVTKIQSGLSQPTTPQTITPPSDMASQAALASSTALIAQLREPLLVSATRGTPPDADLGIYWPIELDGNGNSQWMSDAGSLIFNSSGLWLLQNSSRQYECDVTGALFGTYTNGSTNDGIAVQPNASVQSTLTDGTNGLPALITGVNVTHILGVQPAMNGHNELVVDVDRIGGTVQTGFDVGNGTNGVPAAVSAANSAAGQASGAASAAGAAYTAANTAATNTTDLPAMLQSDGGSGKQFTSTALENSSGTVSLPDIDGKTFQEAMQYLCAVLAGKVSGIGSGTETFLGIDGVTRRVTVTVDPAGTRTAVAYD